MTPLEPGPAPRPPWMRSAARNVLAAPLAGLVAAYTLLGDLLRPLVRPLWERLARLRLVARIRAWVERLGPYQALALVAVPLLLVEPLKLVALYWAATGHPVSGLAGLVLLYVASLLSTERLFAVTKPKLLTIGWFAQGWGWFEAAREWALARARETWVWRAAARLAAHVREAARGWARRLRALLVR